jgi:hypothetical protein
MPKRPGFNALLAADDPLRAVHSMRAIGIGRKNYLFADSNTGGDRAASIYTLAQTAKLNGINPDNYPATRSPRSR